MSSNKATPLELDSALATFRAFCPASRSPFSAIGRPVSTLPTTSLSPVRSRRRRRSRSGTRSSRSGRGTADLRVTADSRTWLRFLAKESGDRGRPAASQNPLPGLPQAAAGLRELLPVLSSASFPRADQSRAGTAAWSADRQWLEAPSSGRRSSSREKSSIEWNRQGQALAGLRLLIAKET